LKYSAKICLQTIVAEQMQRFKSVLRAHGFADIRAMHIYGFNLDNNFRAVAFRA
jgi:hypothetical protein